MEIDESATTVRISVREFAEFSLSPRGGGSYRPWRAQLGTAWHQTLQREETSADAEVAVAAVWNSAPWRIEFQGRIDQLQRDPATGNVLVREIKTVDDRLPFAAEAIRDRCGAHLRQLATYMVLLPVLPAYSDSPSLAGELVLIDIRSGVRQTIPLEHDFRPLFDQQLSRLLAFLERRRRRLTDFQSIDIQSPFSDWRDGQAEAVAELERHSVSHPFIFFDAPTGFGKTGVILHYALKQLQRGVYGRIIYLTGKSTGQIQAAIQLRQMLSGCKALRYFQMRNRREHAIESPRHTCRLSAPCDETQPSASAIDEMDFDDLFAEGTVTLNTIRQLGARTGICPYSISRALLAHAEIWLCDYNYVFAPGQQHILADQPGYSAETTLLIVDEAHNLPSRLCDAYSFALSSAANDLITADVLASPIPRKLDLAWRAWTAWIRQIQRSDRHSGTLDYELIDQIDGLCEAFQTATAMADDLPQPLVNAVFQLSRSRDLLLNTAMPRLLWSPTDGTLHSQCLDPASLARPALQSFGQVVLTSATLKPFDRLQDSLGLAAESVAGISAHCPWRDAAYTVAIDTRVDTRLRKRADYYRKTAETIVQLTAAGGIPIAVFFPSYRYAETIRTYVQTLDAGLTVAIQPRGVDLAGQLEFLDETFISAHALFFILGSSFSESIDHLGGRVGKAMVVGPALPEVNAIQEARMQLSANLGRQQAFDHHYRQPAMNKINQALGRLVRAPGQAAAVLLHCRRFAEAGYRAALEPEYRNATLIQSDCDFVEWLDASDNR